MFTYFWINRGFSLKNISGNYTILIWSITYFNVVLMYLKHLLMTKIMNDYIFIAISYNFYDILFKIK